MFLCARGLSKCQWHRNKLYQVPSSSRSGENQSDSHDFSRTPMHRIRTCLYPSCKSTKILEGHRKCTHLTSSKYSHLIRDDEIESMESVRQTSFHNSLPVYIYKISISVLFYLASICLCVIMISVLLNLDLVSFCNVLDHT